MNFKFFHISILLVFILSATFIGLSQSQESIHIFYKKYTYNFFPLKKKN